MRPSKQAKGVGSAPDRGGELELVQSRYDPHDASEVRALISLLEQTLDADRAAPRGDAESAPASEPRWSPGVRAMIIGGLSAIAWAPIIVALYFSI